MVDVQDFGETGEQGSLSWKTYSLRFLELNPPKMLKLQIYRREEGAEVVTGRFNLEDSSKIGR